MSKKINGSFGLIELSQSAWGYNTEQVEKYLNQFGDRIAAQKNAIGMHVKRIKELEKRVATLESKNAALMEVNEDAQEKARKIVSEADATARRIVGDALAEKTRIIESAKSSASSLYMLETTPAAPRHGRLLSSDLRRFMKDVADVGREYLFDASMLFYYFDTLGYSLSKEKCIFQLAFDLGAIDALNGKGSSKVKQSRAAEILTSSCLLQEPVIKELIQAYIPYL